MKTQAVQGTYLNAQRQDTLECSKASWCFLSTKEGHHRCSIPIEENHFQCSVTREKRCLGGGGTLSTKDRCTDGTVDAENESLQEGPIDGNELDSESHNKFSTEEITKKIG